MFLQVAKLQKLYDDRTAKSKVDSHGRYADPEVHKINRQLTVLKQVVGIDEEEAQKQSENQSNYRILTVKNLTRYTVPSNHSSADL